jgi:hypothetical protein
MDRLTPKDFGPIDVTNAGNNGLVNQKFSNRRATFRNTRKRSLGISVIANEIRSDAADEFDDVVSVENFTDCGAVNVDDMRTAYQPHAHSTSRRFHWLLVRPYSAEQSQVNVEREIASEPEQQMLAVSLNGTARSSIQHRSTAGEPPLRRHYINCAASKFAAKVSRCTMNSMSFGHSGTHRLGY